ncbi:MAG: YeeE/YedE family protein [Myxococcales bacterium]|nr:YeeE/YedE family protein [Myxococcales bacterium]
MMPLHPATFVGYTLAVVFGFGFGFVLERAGFGDAKKLAAQFYLSDMRVLKVMFSAIVTAMLGLTVLRSIGLLDAGAIFINPTYLGAQVVGGVIFGIGFVVGGHCPGTAVVSAATGRLNGLVFLVGVGLGALGFGAVFSKISSFALAGGETKTLSDWLHLPYGVVALLVTALALGFFFGAEWLERFMARRKSLPPAVDGTAAAPAE